NNKIDDLIKKKKQKLKENMIIDEEDEMDEINETKKSSLLNDQPNNDQLNDDQVNDYNNIIDNEINQILPLVCFTCGKHLSKFYSLPKTYHENDLSKVFEKYNINRYCCRRSIITNVDVISKVIDYRNA